MPNKKAITFNKYYKIALNEFDSKFLKTLTVDLGKEFTWYVDLESDLKVIVYFTDPYSSWQRVTNENTNVLIKKFFPKKFDFSTITKKKLILLSFI